MKETRIKFIRGVEGRGEEILKTFEKMGYDRSFDQGIFYENPNFLYTWEPMSDIISYAVDSSIGQLIIAHCEEVFLEPIYKYNTGDKVCYKDKDPEGNGVEYIYTIKKQVNISGKPCYELVENTLYPFAEKDLTPYDEYKYKVGDLVIYKNNVHTVIALAILNGRASYRIDDKNERVICNIVREDQLKPYTGKFRKGDIIKVTQGLSKGKLFRITKLEMLLNEPYYEVESLDGSTRDGFNEAYLEKGTFEEVGGIWYMARDGGNLWQPLKQNKITLSPKLLNNEESKTEVKVWDDLVGKEIDGYCCAGNGVVIEMPKSAGPFGKYNKDWAASTKVAKSALAMAQISQLLSHYGGAITDEEWLDPFMTKYCVERFNGHWSAEEYQTTYHFIAFRTKELRDDFMSYPENVQLVNEYFGLDNNEEEQKE